MSEKSEKLFAEFPEITTEQWEEAIIKDLKGADYNKKLVWKTDEGFSVKPYYRSEDLEGLEYLASQPGQFPYVRGASAENNRWRIVEEIPECDPAEANRSARTSLSKGADAIVFNVSKVADMHALEQLLDGINLKDTVLYFKKPECPVKFSALLADWAAGHPQEAIMLQGALFFDPVMDMLLQGKFYHNREKDMDEAIDAMRRLIPLAPHFCPISVMGHLFGNCGASKIQEMAYSLNIANEYLAYATDHGMDIRDAATHLHFTFSIGSDYFMEIAKLRALRLLWATLTAQYGADNGESARLRQLSIASSWDKTLFDAHINILRNTTEGMSAAIGGAEAILLHPFDEAYKDSDEFSRHIARNAQIILKEESHFDRVVDPAAGSYYLENLTNAMLEQAWNLFRETEKAGGIIEMGLKGEIKAAVEESCNKRNLQIATRRRTILGTNQYPNLTESVSEKIVSMERPQYPGLQPYRGAIPFERLRLETEQWAAKHGGKPKVFLFKIGNLAMRQARAGFVTNFFGCAGYQIVETAGYATAAEGIADAVGSKAAIVAVCSSDDEYPTYAPEIIAEVKKQCPQSICIIAGNPESMEELKAAGAEDFIHVRTNILESLTDYNKKILK